jgi:hypothetical protein
VPFNWTRVVHLERPPKPFTRYDGVVVANKVHSPADMQKVKQMICLFTAAYNRHVNYDIVVFSTLPWRHWQVEELRSVAPETKITVVRDSAPLQDHIASMTPEEVAFLHKRCDVKEGEKLTWFNWCTEEDAVTSRLNYIWQAEFRAYHLWKTKALADYKYMVRAPICRLDPLGSPVNALLSRFHDVSDYTLTRTLGCLLARSRREQIWMDTDAHCTTRWLKDPLEAMITNDLVLMVDNFPMDHMTFPELSEKLLQVYHRTLCSVDLVDGVFSALECKERNQRPKVGTLHGFMHITSLDFYRNETNLRYLELHVGDYRFSRKWEDQQAVTIPAAMLAPDRVWDLRSKGFHLGIHHNGNIDGKEEATPSWAYNVNWKNKTRYEWEAGREMCDSVVMFTG